MVQIEHTVKVQNQHNKTRLFPPTYVLVVFRTLSRMHHKIANKRPSSIQLMIQNNLFPQTKGSYKHNYCRKKKM